MSLSAWLLSLSPFSLPLPLLLSLSLALSISFDRMFAHVEICLRTRKSSTFLLSRFMFLTYLLGTIHNFTYTFIIICIYIRIDRSIHTHTHTQIYRCCFDSYTFISQTPFGGHFQWNAHRSFLWKVGCPYCYFLLAISRRSFMSWFINHPQFHYLQIIFNRIRRQAHTHTHLYFYKI